MNVRPRHPTTRTRAAELSANFRTASSRPARTSKLIAFTGGRSISATAMSPCNSNETVIEVTSDDPPKLLARHQQAFELTGFEQRPGAFFVFGDSDLDLAQRGRARRRD